MDCIIPSGWALFPEREVVLRSLGLIRPPMNRKEEEKGPLLGNRSGTQRTPAHCAWPVRRGAS